MRWPVWFPYPKAFAAVFLLFFLFSLAVTVLVPIVRFSLLVGGGTTVFVDAIAGDFNTLSKFAIFCLIFFPFLLIWLMTIGYQCVGCAAAFIERKKLKFTFNPPLKYWRDAIFGLGLLSLITLWFSLSWASWNELECLFIECDYRQMTDSWDYWTAQEQYDLTVLTFGLLMLLAYAYHLRFLRQDWLEQRRQRQAKQRKKRNVAANKAALPRVQRPHPKRFSKPYDPIDDELEALKQQMREENSSS